MAIREIRNKLKPIVALAPQTINSDTTTNGVAIDSSLYPMGLVFVHSIVWTAGDVTPLIEMADNEAMTTNKEVVPDANLVGDVDTGQEADAILSAAGVKSLGVVGQARQWVRFSEVSANSANVVAQAIAMGAPRVTPITD